VNGDDLPCTEDDIPILAHRAARVVMLDDGAVRFYPVHTGSPHADPFHVDARARCTRHVSHVPPHPECSCGFYSVPADLPAEHELKRWCTVDLLVALYGRVVVHEFGYRAGFQRVFACRLLPCHMKIRFNEEAGLTEICQQPAQTFGWAKSISGMRFLMSARCENHTDFHRGDVEVVWPRDRLVDALAPVPVSDLACIPAGL
jgi:hypothetical protein